MKDVKLFGVLKDSKSTTGIFSISDCSNVAFEGFMNFEDSMYPNTVVGPREGKLFTAVDIGYLPMDRIKEIISERAERWL